MAGTNNPYRAPRALRHAVRMTVLYRTTDSAAWYPGQAIDLSGCGVLFCGGRRVGRNIPVELSMELPRAITGESAVVLLCSARVVRALSSNGNSGPWLHGAAIQSCQVLHPAAPAEAPRASGLRYRANNLLSIIIGTTDLILMRGDRQDDLHAAALRIRTASEELASLLRQSVVPLPPEARG